MKTQSYPQRLSFPDRNIVIDCIKVMEPAILTLIDVLQVTPQLLKACETSLDTEGNFRSDIKSLRLVSRQARFLGLQAVTGCCLKLTSGSGSPQSLVHMAKLLSSSPLQRLRVEVAVSLWPGATHIRELPTSAWQHFICLFSATDRKLRKRELLPAPSLVDAFSANPLHNRTNPTPRQHELSSHTSNLCTIVEAFGTSLARVTSLQITFNAGVAANTQSSQTCSGSRGAHHTISNTSGRHLATILANACPRLQHLGIGGGVGRAALQVLGAKCPLLSHLELLDSRTPSKMMLKLMRQKALPHVTHITLSEGEAQIKRHHGAMDLALDTEFTAVCTCKTLTHLWAGKRHLATAREWEALPPTLQELHCYTLPLEHIPPNIMLANLQRLEIRDYPTAISASQLLMLLQAAPLLRLLSMTNNRELRDEPGRWLMLNPCMIESIFGFCMLHLRMEAGLVLGQICVSSEIRSSGASREVPVRPILRLLHSLSTFTHCVMHDNGVYPSSPATSASLGEVHVKLPDLIYLHLSGIWRETDVTQLMGGTALKTLCLGGLRGVSKAALVKVLLRMPWLHVLEHSSRIVSTGTRELQALLCGCSAGDSGGGSANPSGDRDDGVYFSKEAAEEWIVLLLKNHKLDMLERWCRRTAADDVKDGRDSGDVKIGCFGFKRKEIRPTSHLQL